jgi:hypothetical protein
MTIDRRLFGELRRLDRHDLRRVLIFARGLLMAMGDDAADAAELQSGDPSVTYRLENVKCGKPNCKSCPHGPYWYAYYREGSKLRSRYIGPELPEDVKRKI